MHRFIIFRQAAVLCLLLSGLVPSLVAAPGLQIEPAKTWVGLARVHLLVSEIELSDRGIEGAYEIRVPFLPDRNDTGTMRLSAPRPIDELRRRGGTMAGQARSISGETRDVICEILPDGLIRIDISMKDRTVSFKTRYRLAPQI